ncbi:hypothetical protein QA597_11465 [Marinilabiliaceae bacterium ANBcel2]|nr:hypothetical protein [Marinilabiliaceae bacterium ANBcel2]
MRKSIFKLIALMFLTLSFGIFTVSCSDDDDDNDFPNGENGYDPENLLKGTWLGIYDEAFEGPMDLPANKVLVEFDEDDFMIVTFYNEDQVAGLKGSYHYDESEGDVVLTMTSAWNEEIHNWEETDDFHINMTTYFDGDHALNLTNVDEGVGMEINRITRENPEKIEGAWMSNEAFITLSDNGEFTVIAEESESGYAHKVSYNNKNYLIINFTNSEGVAGQICDYYEIVEYSYDESDDILKVILPDGVLEFNRQSLADGDELVGAWLAIYEEPVLGPGDKDCDILFTEMTDEGDFRILTFLNSDPVAGHIGTYTHYYKELLELHLTEDWNNETFSFMTIPDGGHEQPMAISISEDGDEIMINPEDDALTFNKVMLTDFEEVEGNWEWNYEGNMMGTMHIEDGYAVWQEEIGKQEGTIYNLGDVNGSSYFLFHVTYCEFEPDNDNYAGDDADYFTVSRYELDGENNFTLWHGDFEMALERMVR